MGKFNFDIPDKLHTDFRVAAAKKGKKMRKILVELIQEFVRTR